MGCNCKKKVNGKYNDGDDGREKRNAFGVFFKKSLNVFLYIVCIILAIVAIPFAIIMIFAYAACGKKLELKTPFAEKLKKMNSDAEK